MTKQFPPKVCHCCGRTDRVIDRRPRFRSTPQPENFLCDACWHDPNRITRGRDWGLADCRHGEKEEAG